MAYSTYRNKKIRKIKNVNWINDKKIKLLKKLNSDFSLIVYVNHFQIKNIRLC